MSDIEVNKVVPVILSTINSTVQINIDYMPDFVIVKSVNYFHDFTQPIGQITSDLVDNNIVATFGDTTITSNPQIYHQLKKEVRGSYNFKLLNLDGSFYDLTVAPDEVTLILDFVKYKQKGKIY